MKETEAGPSDASASIDAVHDVDETPPPSVPLSLRPRGAGSLPSTTRYSHRPGQRETLSMPLPVVGDAPPSSRRGTSRMPACIEEIGPATAAISEGRARSTRIRRIADANLGAAPIGSRDAFVLSLIDGQLPLRSLVDVSGMGENELVAVLDRLARLKIVAIE